MRGRAKKRKNGVKKLKQRKRYGAKRWKRLRRETNDEPQWWTGRKGHPAKNCTEVIIHWSILKMERSARRREKTDTSNKLGEKKRNAAKKPK